VEDVSVLIGMPNLQFLIDHGGPVLFAIILLDEFGLPMPAAPFLLAAGALIAKDQLSPFLAFSLTLIACFIADSTWFYLGRSRGNRVLRFLCRISLEPDSCVSRTQNLFDRYGMRAVLIAKFMPGLSAVVAPMAGISGINFFRFLFFDGIGSTLYLGSYLLLGVLFSNQLEKVITAIAGFGTSAFGFATLVAVAYLIFKYIQRYRLLRELRGDRITVDELQQKIQAGQNLVLLDLRSKAALEQDPSIIPGALHMTLDEVEHRRQEIPRDREIIVYCSCPNEVSSARVAVLLRRKGISRVRPLLGGIDAWRDRNFPIQTHPERVVLTG
jgi:membrane protein DedA with SNARE-associated domain/rhodanese-related sulfurtransferase